MFETKPSEDRWKLGFEDAVASEFQFLAEYGFSLVSQEPTLVCFESDRVMMRIYHGRSSYEIGVQMGLLDRNERYGLEHVVYLAGGETAWKREGFSRGTQFQTSTKQGVQDVLSRVAGIVKTYGGKFLSGDVEFYDHVERESLEQRVQFERRSMLAEIKREADEAWSGGDFTRLVELLQPVESDLTKVERKRLEYASAKQANPPLSKKSER